MVHPNSPVTTTDLEARLAQFIANDINPQLAMHGGKAEFLSYNPDKKLLYLELSGGCKGCAMAQVTLKSGIEAAVKEAFSQEVKAVVDKTIHERSTDSYC